MIDRIGLSLIEIAVYLVAAAPFCILTGFLGRRFGRIVNGMEDQRIASRKQRS